MKNNHFLNHSLFKAAKCPKILLSTEDYAIHSSNIRKQHIAKQSTIDSTNSLIHFTIRDILNLLGYLKAIFKEDIQIISAKASFFSEPKPNTKSYFPSKLLNCIKYKTHLFLSLFPYFLSQSQANGKRLNILERYNMMIDSIDLILNFIQNSLSAAVIAQSLEFFSEKECLHYFLQIFHSDFFDYLNLKSFSSKIFSSIWRYFKFSSTKELLYEHLKLFIYGIALPSTNIEEYPLHRAVFEGNLTFIHRICSKEINNLFYCNIEEQDPLGLTPLMLAIKMNKKDAVLVLTECECNTKLRGNPLLKTPIAEAAMQREKGNSVLKYLLLAGHRRKQNKWETEKQNIIQAFESIPDFYCEMNWECDSKFIPFAKKFGPSDTYKIYKKGSFLRVDMTLAGFSKMKCFRGNISALFKGRGCVNEGKLLMVDHEKKKIADILSDLNNDQLDHSIEEMIRNENMSSEFKAENIDFNPSTNWKGEIQKETIGTIETSKFIAKGSINVQTNKRDYLENINFKEFKEFEDYFSYSLENSILKDFHLQSKLYKDLLCNLFK